MYDVFRDGMVEFTAKYKIGDKMKEETDMGPMITEGEAKRVERWVAEAMQAGARVLIGGGRSGASDAADGTRERPAGPRRSTARRCSGRP